MKEPLEDDMNERRQKAISEITNEGAMSTTFDKICLVLILVVLGLIVYHNGGQQ